MFSKDIVESDYFLELSSKAQLLYFHLGMVADDRGYVSNVRTVMGTINATKKELDQLLQSKFVLKRNPNLYLIKGWRINNAIQPTRLVETRFVDDLSKLYYDENNSYTESITDTKCVIICRHNVDEKTTKNRQNADNLPTQDRIGKDSIGKYRIDENNNIPKNNNNYYQKGSVAATDNNDDKFWTAENVSKGMELALKKRRGEQLTGQESVFLQKWFDYCER